MNVRYRLRNFTGSYAPLFWVYHNLFGRRKWLAFGSSTEIVIEGFPRSGNTFAVIAFKIAQDRPVEIAHHLHVPCQVRRAVAKGVPAIVLIRDPLDAITSLLIREPKISPNEAADAYHRFYASLSDVTDKIVVGDFETVTSDFGRVIERVNAKYNTDFGVFDHSDENVSEVFRRIDLLKEDLPNARYKTMSRPSEKRVQLKEAVREKAAAEITADRMTTIVELHRHFTATVA